MSESGSHVIPLRSTDLQIPSAQELLRIASRVFDVVEALAADPPDDMELSQAAKELERGLNPNRLARDDPRRQALGVANWPMGVARALRRLRETHDELLSILRCTAICEGGTYAMMEGPPPPSPDTVATLEGQGMEVIYWDEGEKKAALDRVVQLLPRYERCHRTLQSYLLMAPFSRAPERGEAGGGKHSTDWPPERGWGLRPGEASFDGTTFPIKGIEWKLLKALVELGKPLTCDALRELGWEHDELVDKQTVQMSLSRLRNRLRKALSFPSDFDPIAAVDRGDIAAWQIASTSHVRQMLGKRQGAC